MVSVEMATDRRTIRLQGVGIILIASWLFGLMAVCVRLAARDMPASQIAFIRFAGSLVLLVAATRARHLRPRPGSLRPLLLRGVLGGGAILLYYQAIQFAGAGFATLLHCTYPVWTALFAVLLMGEQFSARLAVALLLNFAGIFVIIGPGAGIGREHIIGGLMALTASVLAGGAVATARHLRGAENASLITIYFMGVGMLMSAPALWSGLPPLSPPLLLALVGVTVSSVLGQWMLHHGLGFATATQGSLAAATSVLSTAVLAALMLGEQLSVHTLLGACLTISAVILAVGRSG